MFMLLLRMEQLEFISFELLVVHQDSLQAIIGIYGTRCSGRGQPRKYGLIDCCLLKTPQMILKMTQSRNRRMSTEASKECSLSTDLN